MRRLIFLCLITILVSSLTVGCSSKKRTRRSGNTESGQQTTQPANNEAGQGENSGEDSSNAENADNNASAYNEAGEGAAGTGNDLDSPAPRGNTARRPRGMRPGDNLRIGGVPRGQADANQNANANRSGRSRGGMRPGDNLRIGGVPRGQANANQNNNATANNRSLGPGRGQGGAGAATAQPSDAFAGGGLPNGFYPQPSTGDVAFSADGTLPNGFYPQSMTGGVAIAPPVIQVKPSTRYREAALAAFQQRNNAAGMANMWAYILASDENLKKYPVRYYPGLKNTSGALRWGIGVSYSNRSDNPVPITIGDPVGYREQQRTPRGRRGTPPRPGGNAPGNQNTTNSDYAMVDVENPEGFVLYYAGDYGDKFLDRLASRFKNEEGFYGDVYKDFQVDYSAESTGATGAANRPQGRRNRRDNRSRDNLSIGGAPRGGNRTAGAGGGAGATAEKTDRLKRLLRSTVAGTPSGDTIGLVMPGVVLVGQGKRDDLLERAKNMDLDLVVIFNVRVSSSRKSTGTTSIKVYNMRGEEGPEDIASGRSLKSDKIADQRAELTDAARDPVALALEKVFAEELDQLVKAADIPADFKSREEQINADIEALASSKPLNVLPGMYKILSYREQGLIEDQFARQQLNRLLGGVLGDTFLSSDEEGRAEMLKSFIARAERALGESN